jgi:hypothetical protein
VRQKGGALAAGAEHGALSASVQEETGLLMTDKQARRLKKRVRDETTAGANGDFDDLAAYAEKVYVCVCVCACVCVRVCVGVCGCVYMSECARWRPFTCLFTPCYPPSTRK